MTITPVVPLPDSQLVVDTQAIIIDFDVEPTVVYVDAVEVWDNSVGFQNSWNGNYIVDTGNWRLVLDPPAPFAVGSTHQVAAYTGVPNYLYSFRVGLEKLTTESDLSAPQVVKVDTYQWSARVHNNDDVEAAAAGFEGPGNVYLQVLDPRGGEIIVVPGNEVGLVWDEGRNKVIVYFVRNGTVFYTEADPGDTPSTKGFPRSLEATIKAIHGGEGHYHQDDASFPPIKLPLDQALGAIHGGAGVVWNQESPNSDSAPTPVIVSGTLSGPPVVIRVERPTRDHEDELLAGYYLVKFFRDTPSIIGYTAMAPEDLFVEFIDSAITPGARYAVMPVYHRWTQRDSFFDEPTTRSHETLRSDVGPKVQLAANSVAQIVTAIHGGEGGPGEAREFYADASFPPIKLPLEQAFGAIHGGEGYFYWLDSSFDPIGT